MIACALAASCASSRRAPARVASPAEPRAADAATVSADAAVTASARDPRDPPHSRRETFRGCGIAVPDDAARETIDMGLRVTLPTDTGEVVSLGVNTRSWRLGAAINWPEMEQSLRAGVAQERGAFMYFRAPLVAGGLADVAWRLHVRLERRERGRFLFEARRYAMVSCAAPRGSSDDVERACDAAIESLTLSREDAPSPVGAPPGQRWTGARGIYAQTPEAWFPQNTGDGAVSVVERHDPRTPIISVNGGVLTQPVAQTIATMRADMERLGAELASWEVRRTASGTKVDYDSATTSTTEHFIRQQILIDGWRMCVGTCAGPEAFVVADDSFCGRWLPTMRVER